MIWIDFIIVVVVLLSAMIGFVRGFLKEAVGLAAWILAFYLAFSYWSPVSGYLDRWIDIDSARRIVAFAIIFVAVLIVGAAFNYLLGRLVRGSGLAGTDRILGVVFGALRGVAVLVLLVLLAGVTSLPRDQWWQESVLLDHLETGAVMVRDHLPPDLAGAISYPDRPDAPSAPDTSTA